MKRRLLAVLLPLLLLGANGWFLFTSLEHLVEASRWVRQSMETRHALTGLEADLVNAETGQRGYLITSDELYLQPYHRGLVLVHERMQNLASLAEEDATLARRLGDVQRLVGRKLDEMAGTMEAHAEGGFGASLPLVKANRGKVIMDNLRTLIFELQSTQATLLSEREANYAKARTVAIISFLVLIAATLGMLGVIYWIARREFHSRNKAAGEIAEYAATLKDAVRRLESERNEIAQLNDAGNFLQSCGTMKEVGELAGPFLQRLFPTMNGGLYLYAASRNQLSLIAGWGQSVTAEHMDPTDCWSLRRGKRHAHANGDCTPACGHFHEQGDMLCVPLNAHGEAVGTLALHRLVSGAPFGKDLLRLADMIAHQLGLTLSNIKLRETLNEQSIRDPLTDAYNRRYLDLIGKKEFAQAARREENLVVAMLDIDHFKRFNDLNGHLAGDVALSSVVKAIQAELRVDDWLFRYGGEEFLIMMRGVPAEAALERLSHLARVISELQLSHGDDALPGVTISIGYSIFPEDGTSLEDLISLADEALYQAKTTGRNRVCAAVARQEEPLRLSA